MEISNHTTTAIANLDIDAAVLQAASEPQEPVPVAAPNEPLDAVLRDIQGQLERLRPKNLHGARQLLEAAKAAQGAPPHEASELTPYLACVEQVQRWQDDLLQSGDTIRKVIALLDENSNSRQYGEKVLGQRRKVLEPLSAAMIEGTDGSAAIVTWQASVIEQLSGLLPGEIRAQGDKMQVPVPAFFDQLIELIDLIGDGYLSVHQNIVRKYSAFFDTFNSKITSKLQQWMTAVNEGKDIELDVAELKKALQELMADLDGVLFNGSKADAKNWCEALGLPATSLKENADGTWSVMIDLSPLEQMIDDLDKFDLDDQGKVVLDSASFQAWQSGFNAQTDRLKNKLQEFTQKYSSANSTYDNFIKVLSNHINQFADMLKAMAHF